jgi:hypothetical protein
MIGRMIRASGTDDIAGGRLVFRFLRFLMIDDSVQSINSSSFVMRGSCLYNALSSRLLVSH